MATSNSRVKAQGRKWNFLKQESSVFTVYHHNKAVILTSKAVDPGCVVSIAESGDDKILIKYETGKQMKLGVKYFTPADDISKILYLEISDIGKFLRRAGELYGIKIEDATTFNKKRRESGVSRQGRESNINPSQPSPPKRSRPANEVLENDQTDVEESTEESTEAQFSDEMKSCLITKSLVPVKVLVTSLKEPRKDNLLRETDEAFVKGLIKEFQENTTIFMKPLIAIVRGLQSVEDFDNEILDSYELEVIGGNHRRAALQELYKDTKDERFKWASVLLFCEMPKSMVLKLAAKHNRQDSFCHSMTTQDKVKLCNKILVDDFEGKKSTKWRDTCVDILNASKDSLEFVFLLSSLEEDSFRILLQVFNGFEKYQLKGQGTSAKQTKKLISGISQNPSIVGSKFKCLRGLPNDKIKEVLTGVKNVEVSLKEMKVKADEWKSIRSLKTEFVKLAGVNAWEDVQKRFPLWSSVEKLKPFAKDVRHGKTPDSFKAFVQRCLTSESSDDSAATEDTMLTRENSLWLAAPKISAEWKITSSVFENLQFGGANFIFIQDEKDWNNNMVKGVIRSVCSINTRQKCDNYIMFVRKAGLENMEDYTPDGKEEMLFVVNPSKTLQRGNTLTNATECLKILFVGNVQVNCRNFVIAESEEILMEKLLDNFLPANGTVLEIGCNQGSMALLRAAFNCDANIISLYKEEAQRNLFMAEGRRLMGENFKNKDEAENNSISEDDES